MSELSVSTACSSRRPSGTRAGGPVGVAAVPPPAAARRPAGARALRLTRRGRVILMVVFSVLLLGAFSIGRVSSHASAPDVPAVQRTVVVHAGDTLWSIARQASPGQDPRPVVARIAAENHLTGSTVRVGQRLVLPRG